LIAAVHFVETRIVKALLPSRGWASQPECKGTLRGIEGSLLQLQAAVPLNGSTFALR
jgi:hypothetical protein